MLSRRRAVDRRVALRFECGGLVGEAKRTGVFESPLYLLVPFFIKKYE